MKRIFSLVIAAVLFCTCFAGCKKTMSSFEGSWDCADSLLENEDLYTGYYKMNINSDGSFSIYDAEAGEPGIRGTLTIDSETEITVECEGEDFDPPWTDMSETDTLQYEFVGNDELHLSYTGERETRTLVFYRYS